jgi:hypothetical protein
MEVVSENRTVSHLEEKIILTLLYYDIFSYPLKVDEVFRFLGTNHIDLTDIKKELKGLKRKKLVFQFGDFFSVQNSEVNVVRRLRGNDFANRSLPLAKRRARLIARFPFVRAVMASGSLAKGYMDQNSDLDFFIVTEPGRLWIARTLLVMYKRLFLFNSHKHFCVNYFIDSDHLEIEEKNLFTATELATVIPLYGGEYYDELQRANKWITSLFPNYHALTTTDVPPSNRGLIKKIAEKFLSVLGGDKLERFFKRLTLRRWNKIYRKQFGDSDFQIAFKSKDYASKNHPNHYQRKVEDLYFRKVGAFQVKLESNWTYE